MEFVQRRAPINDLENRKKTSYVIVDGFSSFYYRYVFRYASQRSVLDPEVVYARFVADDFENRHVPHAFEEVCRQYLVRENRASRIDPPFDLIGRYSYDDPASRTNRTGRSGGEFDVVTHDPNGYAFHEAKFRGAPVTARMIEEEKAQVRRCGLDCYKFGFFSRSGFAAHADEETALIDLAEVYRE